MSTRYVTKGVISTLDREIIFYLWNLLDQFINTTNLEIDYLQIFKLSTIKSTTGYELVINHQQEVPNYQNIKRDGLMIQSPIEEKIYIIADQDEDHQIYHTMLFAHEY